MCGSPLIATSTPLDVWHWVDFLRRQNEPLLQRDRGRPQSVTIAKLAAFETFETQDMRERQVAGFGGLLLAGRWWYDDRMLKIRMKRDAKQNAAAMKRLTQIETSIIELPNEDLLDLADIFREESETAIARYAFAEMARRNISL